MQCSAAFYQCISVPLNSQPTNDYSRIFLKNCRPFFCLFNFQIDYIIVIQCCTNYGSLGDLEIDLNPKNSAEKVVKSIINIYIIGKGHYKYLILTSIVSQVK